MELREVLRQVQNGTLSPEEAEERLKDLPYEELDFAKLDHHRALRSGFGEVIYCEGKSMEQLVSIFCHFADHTDNVLGTRASKEQYEAVAAKILGTDQSRD